MKGSPLAETFICLFVVLLLLLPLSRRSPFYQREASPTIANVDEEAEMITCWVSARFSHPVISGRITLGETTFEAGEDPMGITFETELPLEGTSVVLDIEWPNVDGTPYAQITIEPDGLEEQTVGLWGKPGVQRRRWFITPKPPE